MTVKISIVIPTFKRPALLKQCLKALMRQEFSKCEYEIIVVSDGPDETTSSVVNDFSSGSPPLPSIKYDFLPLKKGPAAARNKGWKQARGELIAFTDDDCIPNRYWLETIWKAYVQNKGMAFTGKVLVPRPPRPTDHERNISLLENAAFVTANCFCPREVLEQVGGFDERFSIAWREDSDLEFRLLQNHIRITYIEDAIIIHPVRQARWGVSLNEQQKSRFNALLYKKHPSLYRKKIQRAPPLFYYATILSFCCIWIGLFIFRSFWFSIVALCIWFFLTGRFILKRLSGNTMEIKHITEIVITSLLIPFLSVFWRLYGAIKYRVWFL